MNRKNMTRNALFTSIVSLLLCVSMLVGTTFAWFTDSVTSANNIIASGNLDVELYYKLDVNDAEWKKVTSDTELFDDAALWEPGYTQVVYLKVVNEGSLALKYQIGMNVVTETLGKTKDGADIQLSKYIMYGTKEYTAETEFPTTREAARAAITGKEMFDQYDHPVWNKGELESTGSDLLALVAYMPESVGNEANHDGTNVPSIQLGLNITATQLAAEEDSFDETYDEAATLPNGGSGTASAPGLGVSAIEVAVRDKSTNAKLATFTVPAEAVADNATKVDVNVEPTDANPNISVTADEEIATFDVTVTGLKEGNTTLIKVKLRIPAGLDPATVKLYHYDTEISCTYNPADGYVTFESATFSPFSVVYDAESEYVPPVVEEGDLPKAEVVQSTEYEYANLPWGSYGGWSPTEGLDSYLEAAYTFSCLETEEQAAQNPYAYWYCDFVVKLDTDLGANELFLGGNYGDFGWVGFHNGELELEANTEVPLLGSVTNNPWTYLDVVKYVGTFICGVGDVDNALEGATFTVMLRLTNPEDENEYYDVATITYTFDDTVACSTAAELQEALLSGKSVVMVKDIDLNDTIVNP